MPLQATSGAASYDAFGGGVPVEPVYIEQIFSTYLYTGNDTTQTITNGIDLSTKGGLVWIKARTAAYSHILSDTNRGTGKFLSSNTTDAQGTDAQDVTAFNTTGFTVGNNSRINNSSFTYASWTFRKQPKFFDIVTYTGNGSSQTINHNLGSVPGVMIVKSTTYIDNWAVYHRSLGATKYIELNNTNAASTSIGSRWDAEPTSTSFSVGYNGSVNASGETYVAYLFAHNAGGFGSTNTDNVISCGSYTGTGALNNQITLGYEPQLVIVKAASISGENWWMLDNMRGMPVQNSSGANGLRPNTNNAEASPFGFFPTATGFVPADTGGAINQSGATYIYIAIRRGPMKVPTTGTSVYNAIVRNGTGANATVTGVGFPVDLDFTSYRPATHNPVWSNRLVGAQRTLSSRGTYAEQTETTALTSFAFMDGVSYGANTSDFFNGFNSATGSYVNWFFRRAPSVFDIVCDTGTGAGHTINHNLGVVPQLMIRKRRDSTSNWCVYPNDITQVLFLDATNAFGTNGATYWNSTAPTASVFSIGTNADVNTNGGTYLTYLFATCPGVSKVGSYTGTGTTQTINCGFTTGTRWVMIKRTDSSGDWYIWDSARGIIAGNDPYLLANTTDAEVTGTDYVDTAATGFEISSTAPAAINANGGTYIFLAIA